MPKTLKGFVEICDGLRIQLDSAEVGFL